MRAFASVVAVALVLAASAAAAWQPAQHTTWQIQHEGAVDTTVAAQMYDIDLFDARPGQVNGTTIATLHRQGVKVVCYMDTGAWESYRPDQAQFPASVIGNSTGWTGERYLDIRPQSWHLFEPLIVARMQVAVSLGCDGIDADQNNSADNNPGFPITHADENAWYLEVAADAHSLGLSAGMMNGMELFADPTISTPMLVASFDWALNEECFHYKECGLLTPFLTAGKPVFNIEYAGSTATFCPKANRAGIMSVKKKPSLYSYRVSCWS